MSESAVDIRHREKFTSVIDFCKTIITLGTALIAGIASLIFVTQAQLELNWRSVGCLGALTLSMILAVFGFGKSIGAVGSGADSTGAIALANVSFFLLLGAGILAIFVARDQPQPLSVDGALSVIATNTTKLSASLAPAQMRSLTLQKDDYVVEYDAGGKVMTVTINRVSRQIVAVK